MKGSGGDSMYVNQFGIEVQAANVVPEPATLALLGLGLASLAGMRRRTLVVDSENLLR